MFFWFVLKTGRRKLESILTHATMRVSTLRLISAVGDFIWGGSRGSLQLDRISGGILCLLQVNMNIFKRISGRLTDFPGHVSDSSACFCVNIFFKNLSQVLYLRSQKRLGQKKIFWSWKLLAFLCLKNFYSQNIFCLKFLWSPKLFVQKKKSW